MSKRIEPVAWMPRLPSDDSTLRGPDAGIKALPGRRMDTPNTEWKRGVDIADIAEWKTLQIDVRTAQFVLVDDVQKIVDRLERECAELRRDAERYRWLRENFEFATGPRPWMYHHFVFPDDAERMDAAIDAALAPKEKS